MTPIQNHTASGIAVAVSLSIEDVPEEVLERLRARAERNHRSLQKEAARHRGGGCVLGVGDHRG